MSLKRLEDRLGRWFPDASGNSVVVVQDHGPGTSTHAAIQL